MHDHAREPGAATGLHRYVEGPYPFSGFVAGEYQGILSVNIPFAGPRHRTSTASTKSWPPGPDGTTRVVAGDVRMLRGESRHATRSGSRVPDGLRAPRGGAVRPVPGDRVHGRRRALGRRRSAHVCSAWWRPRPSAAPAETDPNDLSSCPISGPALGVAAAVDTLYSAWALPRTLGRGIRINPGSGPMRDRGGQCEQARKFASAGAAGGCGQRHRVRHVRAGGGARRHRTRTPARRRRQGPGRRRSRAPAPPSRRPCRSRVATQPGSRPSASVPCRRCGHRAPVPPSGAPPDPSAPT